MIIRKQLVKLNSKDIRLYFQGFRKIYDNLFIKKQEIKVLL